MTWEIKISSLDCPHKKYPSHTNTVCCGLLFDEKDEFFECKINNCPNKIKLKKFARKCDHCGKVFNEGYCIEGGCEYYCSKECLHEHVTPKEWDDLYNNGDGESYWTVWEDKDDYQYYEDGTEVEE